MKAAPSLRIAIVAAALLLAWPAGAQGLKVTERLLPNGLKVLLKEDHKSPVVTFQIWYRVGSRHERLGKTGLSHLLEHMMFKGTEKYGPKVFSRLIQKNGGNSNAFTGKDYTAYFETLAADRIEIALELEADRMTNLLLDEGEFLTEREVVKEERRMRYEDDPASTLREQVTAAAFLAHPYQWPVIGWMADLDSLTARDLREHYQTFYRPNNATIVVAGDFETERLFPLIERNFGAIPSGPPVPAVGAREPSQQGERRLVLKREAELAAVYVAYKAPNATHPDFAALNCLEAILATGRSSRLHRRLVEEKRLALEATAGYDDASADPGLFTIYASVMPGKSPEEVEKAIYEELEHIKDALVKDGELAKAKNQIEAAFVMGQDSVFYQAMLLGRYETAMGWRHLETYLERIRAVTAEDVRRVARQYLSEDNRTVGVLLPTVIKGER